MTRVPVRSSPLAFSLTLLLAAYPAARSQGPDFASQTTTVAEQYLLSAANQERAARGLSQLHRDARLAHAAAGHAQAMAAHASISHQFAGEPELTQRGASAGVAFSEISENVAEAPSVVQIHEMWMHSEHHRENLLDPAIDAVGISVIERRGELYAVEDFVRTTRAVSLEEQESAISALVGRQGRVSLASDPERVAAARQTCTMPSGYAGAWQPWFVMRFTASSLNELPEQLKTRMASGRYRLAAVGACAAQEPSPFTAYNFAVLLYP
jgi:uncharacterized protein YkwD